MEKANLPPIISVVSERMVVLNSAKIFVDPIVEQHGLKPNRSSAPAFSSPETYTEAEQHVQLVMDVADWLLRGANYGA